MTAQERFDQEMERRQLTMLSPSTIAKIRRVLRFPETAEDILHERLLLGCIALDERETDKRWQLFEAILTAWCIARDVRAERKAEAEAAYIHALRTDPERRAMRARYMKLGARSLREYDEYEAQKAQQQMSESVSRQPEVTGPMTVKGRTNPKWL